MHSMTDCMAGVILGASIWAVHVLWWIPIEDWLVGASTSSPASWLELPVWGGPAIAILLCGLMVHKHPQPVDDCPCFEDAIAFVSVQAGIIFARWMAVMTGYDDADIVSHMAGEAFPFSSSSSSPAAAQWRSATVWWGTALLKLTLGISLIFAWRLLAKALMHHFLPALFRVLTYKVLPRLGAAGLLPKGTNLPHRRFYIPATEYEGPVPGEDGLHPIPSVMDLRAMAREGEERFEVDGEAGGMKRRRRGMGRTSSDDIVRYDEKKAGRRNTNVFKEQKQNEDNEEDVVKHYDADGKPFSGLFRL